MKQQLERFMVAAWYNNSSWLFLLSPLRLIFNLIRVTRYFWFSKLVPKKQLQIRTVIIGNISSGGSGKTSLSSWIARKLEQKHNKLAVISKGYGRDSSLPDPTVVTELNPSKYGDEPCLLWQQISSPVVVCDDRLKAMEEWQHKVDFLICDDGLQDYRFSHDCEIALIDGDIGFGNGKLLPEGFLREPVSRLQKCNMVLQLSGNEILAEADAQFHYYALGCRQLTTGKLLSVRHATELWQTKTIDAYAALANNRRFFSFINDLGFKCQTHALPDHHRYKSSDFEHACGIKLITAKDAVKCHRFADASYWSLEIDVRLDRATADKLIYFVTGKQ